MSAASPSMALAVVRRPHLWPAALRLAGAAVPSRWWRRRPHLPVPSREFVAFRLQAHTGDASQAPEVGELVAYLEWCRDMDRHRRR